MIITKPLSPKGLYDRLVWVAFDTRAFVESKTYYRPDRRFKIEGSRTVRAAAKATCRSKSGPTSGTRPIAKRNRLAVCGRSRVPKNTHIISIILRSKSQFGPFLRIAALSDCT